ncbi:aspartyl protease family protein [Photorhabdus asymbiotica]|uniref:aspartyl protease family protein n=1 Tax=Photorhabdus asymbiotica TaxID=291112 RepID=UPI003DA6DB09
MHFSLSKHIKVTALVAFSSIMSLFVTDSMASEKVMHINFQFDEFALPIANLEIDGKTQDLMIDTGSTIGLHLSKNLMSKISGLVIEPEKARSTDLTGKIFLNDKFNIPQLSINGMMFKNVTGVSLTPWGMKLIGDNNLPSSMVMGLDLFKGKVVLIDYKSRKLSVSDHLQELGVNVDKGWIKLPLRLTKEGIAVKVSQNFKSYNMVLDTGASVSMFWKERLKSPPVNISCQAVVKEMDNEGCVASTFQLDEMGVEGIKLNSVLVDGGFNQLDTDGLIGNNFFNKYAVLIDFPGKRLFIKENS